MSHYWIYLFINSYVHRCIAQVTNLKSTQSIQTQVPGFDEAKKKKQETNINLMYSYVKDTCFVRYLIFFFVRLCGSREIYILYIYRDKYIL